MFLLGVEILQIVCKQVMFLPFIVHSGTIPELQLCSLQVNTGTPSRRGVL